MTLTMLISVPAAVFFLNWLGTIWRGSIRFDDADALRARRGLRVRPRRPHGPLPRRRSRTDLYLHDTIFVVGHFHLTMAAAVFLGAFAAIYFWFPKMFGTDAERDGSASCTSGCTVVPIIAGLRRPARRRATRACSAASTTRSSTRSSSTCAALNQLHHATRRSSSARRSSSSSSNFFSSLSRGREGGREPVGGRHARVDAPLAARAPQLRRDPASSSTGPHEFSHPGGHGEGLARAERAPRVPGPSRWGPWAP